MQFSHNSTILWRGFDIVVQNMIKHVFLILNFAYILYYVAKKSREAKPARLH